MGISDGRVVDGQLNSSSSYVYGTPQEGRVNFQGYQVSSSQGCWRPRTYNKKEYISVDLMVKHEIGELVLQGAAKTIYYVKKYHLSYSDDGVNFKDYTGTGTRQKVKYLLCCPVGLTYSALISSTSSCCSSKEYVVVGVVGCVFAIITYCKRT